VEGSSRDDVVMARMAHLSGGGGKILSSMTHANALIPQINQEH